MSSRLAGYRLTLGEIAITLALLAALGVTIITYGYSESHWQDTVHWGHAIEAAERQVNGIQDQRSAQALYAATGDPRYRRAFAAGVRTATAGFEGVLAIGDPRVSKIAAHAQAQDLHHDQVVRNTLFPAIERHDTAAIRASLPRADRFVSLGLASALQIAERVRALRTDDIREARKTERRARYVGLASLVLAVLTGLLGTVVVIHAQRRRREANLERERLLDLTRAQNNDLVRLDRAKDAFIASVSHELRTPLTSIRGYTELVGEAGGNLSAEQHRFLEIVDRNAGRLLRLINDLLLAAQIDTVGQLEIERHEVDLCALVEQAVESAAPAASMKDIELRCSTEGPLTLQGDSIRLAQVIDNLISNAVKFTGNGGRITVALSSSDGTARVSVADTGMGMTTEERARLFERFYRTEGASQGAIQGSGLGLAIALAIARAHGGTIAVESEPGVGSTFTLELPWNAADDRTTALSLSAGDRTRSVAGPDTKA